MKVQLQKDFFKNTFEYSTIVRIYNEVCYWIKMHFTKDFWNVLKTVLKSYPYQESFLVDIEKAKIVEMIHYHEKRRFFIGWENVVRDMKICLSLIDIFTEEKGVFGYDGDLKFKKLDNGDYEVIGDDLKYHCDVKVNLKNIDRFIPNKEAQKWVFKHPHELYILKARALYFKIRDERGEEWWD